MLHQTIEVYSLISSKEYIMQESDNLDQSQFMVEAITLC